MKIQGTRPEGAPFEPISPAVSISNLLVTTPNFRPVQRIDARRITPANLDPLGSVIKDHVITKGLPLVLENWHLRSDWPKWHFNPEWLKENHGADHIAVRDIPHKSDMLMSLGHYLNNLGKLASKFSPSNYVSGKQQRLYGKDLDCPQVWRNSLANILPSSTTYLNPKADLMSSLPPDARAENLMCYIGHEGTYTPAHKEMCASLGQNIMVYASQNGPNSEAGSSIWFMTAMAERDQVAEYWLGSLGHDIEVEAHFASLENLQKAPFTVYVVEQKLGDYILVPPLAPHQVWNRGTCTMKVAWNRTTTETLQLAMQEALPKARIVCRDEQYKNKNIIYDTLKRWTKILRQGTDVDKNAPSTIKTDYRNLFDLFNTILLDECFSPLLPAEKNVELIPNDYNVTCSFCRGNIFNRFLSCKRCSAHSDDIEPYDVCMDCYARGRSCYCVSGLSWVEQYPWSELLKAHTDFRSLILELETSEVTFDLPKSLQDALPLFHRKTLARVCQEVLKTRPYVNPDVIEEPDDTKEIERKKKKGKLLKCHPCCHLHPSWKAALCSSPDCTKAYCYGNLWRAFDMDPFFDVLSKFEWKCPFCLQICSCGTCRKRGRGNPYVPRGTILGSVTKHVSDPRSVESLVDFGKGNAGWRVDGITGNKRKRFEDGDDQSVDDGALKPWAPGLNNFEADSAVVPAENIDPALTNDFHSMESLDGGSSFDDENKKVAAADEYNMFKADSSAAGLEVVQIPIDPALGGDEQGVSNQTVGLSESYARLFENPTTAFAPTSESRSYLFPTNHTVTSAATNYHSNGVNHGYHDSEMDDVQEPVNYSQDNENDKALDHVEDNGHHESTQLPPAPTETFWGHDQQDHDHESPSNGFHPASYNPDPLSNLLPHTTTLSALEKNPLAFLAAAGLLHAGQQENTADNLDGSSFNHAQGIGAPGPSDVAAMGGYVSGSLGTGVPGSVPQDISKGKIAKRKAERIESDVFASNLPENRNSAISEWVFKQKKGGKKRKLNGSKIVVLKISPDAWRRYNAKVENEKEEKAQKLMKRFGDGDVKTDITPNNKKRRGPQRSPSVEWKTSKSVGPSASPPKETRRGRPSKKTYVEIDSDDEGSMGSARETPTVGMGETGSATKGGKTSRRSMRGGELMDGLETTVTPKRRHGGPGRPRKHPAIPAVEKPSESPAPPEIRTPNEAHEALSHQNLESPSQAASAEEPVDEDAQPVDLMAEVEEVTGEASVEVQKQKESNSPIIPSETSMQQPVKEASTVLFDEGNLDASPPSKSPLLAEIAAAESAADSSDDAMDFGAGSVSDDDDDDDGEEQLEGQKGEEKDEGAKGQEEEDEAEMELETEEQRRKRLVAEALAEAKSAALRVAEGVPATDIVSAELPPFTVVSGAELSDSDEGSLGDEGMKEAEKRSSESSLQSENDSIASPAISPQSSTPETTKPNPTLFEIVIIRRPSGWAKKAGYTQVVVSEDALDYTISPRETLTPDTPLRSPSIIPAVEPVVVPDPRVTDGELPPSARKRGRPGRQRQQSTPGSTQMPTFSQNSTPSKLSDMPSTPSIETTKRRGRQPRSQRSQSELTPAPVEHLTATAEDQMKPKSQKRGRPRQDTAQEETVPLAVEVILDRQESPPVSKSTLRPRGRPSRGSLNNRRPTISSPMVHPSPRSGGRTSFTSINRQTSQTSFSIETPSIVQKSSPLSQKTSRGRGRPSRGRGGARVSSTVTGRKHAISNASEESNDAVFFREMLGGDFFASEVKSPPKETNIAKNRASTEQNATKTSATNQDDDDMEWWD